MTERDTRTYIRVHDGMPDHPKVDPLSDAAFRLLVSSWCWASRHLTDGQMPAGTWSKRGTAKARGELLAAGLVEQVDDSTVRLHDYLQHQRSAAEVAELREKRVASGRAGGLAKAARTASKRLASATANAKQAAGKAVAETETDTDLPTDVGRRARKRAATPAPDTFPITDPMAAWGRENAPLVADPHAETARWLDWCRANGKTYADWTAAWRTWMSRAQRDAATGRPVLRAVNGRPGPPPGTPVDQEWRFQ